MSSSQNESNRSPVPTGSKAARGLDQAPIILEIPGWLSPIGWTTSPHISFNAHTQDSRLLEWYCLTFSIIHLTKTAALLLLQGLTIDKLFPGTLTLFFSDIEHKTSFDKPLLLLKRGELNLYAKPSLKDVTIALIYEADGYSEDEIKSVLLQKLLGT